MADENPGNKFILQNISTDKKTCIDLPAVAIKIHVFEQLTYELV